MDEKGKKLIEGSFERYSEDLIQNTACKLVACENAEAVKAECAKEGIGLSAEEAEAVFKLIEEGPEISPKDLEAVAGGEILDGDRMCAGVGQCITYGKPHCTSVCGCYIG